MNPYASKSESFRRRNPHLFGPENCVNTAAALLGKAGQLIKQSSKPTMNKTETQFLGMLRGYGWKVILCQAVKLKLANGVWYCPDFITFGNPDDKPIVAWEVKGGHVWDDAIVKVKVAATQFPFVEWRLAHKQRGLWQYQIVFP